MTSGFTLIPFFWTSAAASKMARACISVISGKVMPRRQPRWPSIGLNSCSSWTRLVTSSGVAPSFLGQVAPGGVVVGQELVEGRVEEADGGGQALEGLEDADEILPLITEGAC